MWPNKTPNFNQNIETLEKIFIVPNKFRTNFL